MIEQQMSPRNWYQAILIFSLVAIFLCYALALQVSPSVLTNQLMRDLNLDATSLGLITGSFFYAYTLMQIPAGLFYDRSTIKTSITLAIVLCVWGVLFFGVAHGPILMTMGRLCMGIGSAFAFIGLLVVGARWFPAYYFPMIAGVAQLLASLGAMLGQAPLAWIATKYGWHGAFDCLALIGAVLAILAWLFVKDPPDYIRLQKNPAPALKILTALKMVLRQRQTWWIGLYAFTNWAPVTAFAALWGVPFLMTAYGLSNQTAALACAMIWLGQGFAGLLLGWWATRIQRRKSLLNGCALLGLLTSALLIYIPNLPMLLILVLLLGFGVATTGQVISFALVKDNNSDSTVATAIGVNNMAVVIGGAIFQPLVGFLLHLNWNGALQGRLPIYNLHAYQHALCVVPICFFCGCIISAFWIQDKLSVANSL